MIDDAGMGTDERRDRRGRLDPPEQGRSTTSASRTSRSRARSRSTFRFDPLDKAVERLWFSGVVVVAAAGNYADTGRRGRPLRAGNDPFVITVGAQDVNDTLDAGDDFVAPWSAYGSTLDGFPKPELSAPGRYIVGAVPRARPSRKSGRPDRRARATC